MSRPKIIPRKPNGTLTLAALVAECFPIVQELRRMDTPIESKLTAKASLSAAIRVAFGKSKAQPDAIKSLRELEQKIFHSEPPAWFQAQGVVRRMGAAFRSSNWPGPSAEMRRYNFLMSADALAEIVALGSSTFEIAALAMLLATEKFPESFGACEDLTAHYQRIVELSVKRDELYKQIEEMTYAPEDILTSDADSKGRVTQTFALSNGKVMVHPKAGRGERLVTWMLNNQASS